MSYADRVKERKDKVEEKKVSQTKLLMSAKEIEFARALVALMNNESFKIYLQFESYELGDTLATAFDAPNQGELNGASFGEQMAFKKGGYVKLLKWRKRREELVKRYAYYLEQDKQTKKGEQYG